MYERASERDRALRAAARKSRPPLSQLRTTAIAYERLVRRYPRSGYTDNALWNGAELALFTFSQYEHAEDRERASVYLDWLIEQYPHSSLVDDARTRLASLQPKAAETPVPRDDLVTVRSIRRTILPDVIRVTVELDDEVPYEISSLDEPARIFFDLAGTQVATSLVESPFEYRDDLLRTIRLGRHENATTRVVLDLDHPASHSVFALYNPYRLVIDLSREPAESGRRLPAAGRDSNPSGTVVASHADRPAGAPPTAGTSVRLAPGLLAEPTIPVPKPFPTPSPRRPPETAAVRPPVDTTPVSPGAPEPEALPGAGRVAELATAPDLVATEGNTEGDMEAGAEAEPGPDSEAVAATADAAPLPGPATAVAPRAEAPAPQSPETNAGGGYSMARQLGLGVSRIVIDPGHGGHDPGTSGAGVSESDVVLDIALRLERLLLQEPGFDVVLTRRTDVFIPLEERTAIANREAADLFLSIHVNASRNRNARGIETYVLNFSSNPEAEEVAARENSASAQAMHKLPDLVQAIALNNKLDESRDLASLVQQRLVSGLRPANPGTPDRGVKQAPFVVLIGAKMPSVLAEVSFVSHRAEGKLLGTGAYRQAIAESLGRAVIGYQQSLKSAGTLSTQ